jgi:hypothetical protein
MLTLFGYKFFIASLLLAVGDIDMRFTYVHTSLCTGWCTGTHRPHVWAMLGYWPSAKSTETSMEGSWLKKTSHYTSMMVR